MRLHQRTCNHQAWFLLPGVESINKGAKKKNHSSVQAKSTLPIVCLKMRAIVCTPFCLSHAPLFLGFFNSL
jgi:hypothetical protein